MRRRRKPITDIDRMNILLKVVGCTFQCRRSWMLETETGPIFAAEGHDDHVRHIQFCTDRIITYTNFGQYDQFRPDDSAYVLAALEGIIELARQHFSEIACFERIREWYAEQALIA